MSDTEDLQIQKHDSFDDDGYKQRCFCQKCKKQFDEWCKQKKVDGKTKCQRKCVTVCTIVCKKPVTKITKWSFKQKFEGKWEKIKGDIPVPKPCKSCKKDKKKCKCDKN